MALREQASAWGVCQYLNPYPSSTELLRIKKLLIIASEQLDGESGKDLGS